MDPADLATYNLNVQLLNSLFAGLAQQPISETAGASDGGPGSPVPGHFPFLPDLQLFSAVANLPTNAGPANVPLGNSQQGLAVNGGQSLLGVAPPNLSFEHQALASLPLLPLHSTLQPGSSISEQPGVVSNAGVAPGSDGCAGVDPSTTDGRPVRMDPLDPSELPSSTADLSTAVPLLPAWPLLASPSASSTLVPASAPSPSSELLPAPVQQQGQLAALGPATSTPDAVDAASVDAAPVDAVPVHAAPVGAVPMHSAPVDPVPVQAAPVDPVPVHAAPVDAAPVDAVPVHATAVNAAPVHAAPADPVPVDAVPVDAAPVDAAPVDAAPVHAAPVDPVPVDAVPVHAAPVDAAPVDAAPVHAAPVDPVPVDPVPVHAAPVDAAPVHSAPVEVDAVSVHGATVDAVPGDAAAVDAVPGDAAAVDAVPGDAAAIDAVPVDSAPAVPGDAAAVDVVPVDAAPVDAVPVAAAPAVPVDRASQVDAVPVAAAPVDVDPVVSAPGETVPVAAAPVETVAIAPVASVAAAAPVEAAPVEAAPVDSGAVGFAAEHPGSSQRNMEARALELMKSFNLRRRKRKESGLETLPSEGEQSGNGAIGAVGCGVRGEEAPESVALASASHDVVEMESSTSATASSSAVVVPSENGRVSAPMRTVRDDPSDHAEPEVAARRKSSADHGQERGIVAHLGAMLREDKVSSERPATWTSRRTGTKLPLPLEAPESAAPAAKCRLSCEPESCLTSSADSREQDRPIPSPTNHPSLGKELRVQQLRQNVQRNKRLRDVHLPGPNFPPPPKLPLGGRNSAGGKKSDSTQSGHNKSHALLGDLRHLPRKTETVTRKQVEKFRSSIVPAARLLGPSQCWARPPDRFVLRYNPHIKAEYVPGEENEVPYLLVASSIGSSSKVEFGEVWMKLIVNFFLFGRIGAHIRPYYLQWREIYG